MAVQGQMTNLDSATSESSKEVLQRFEQNYEAVTRLMEFDNVILTFAKTSLQSVQAKLKIHHPNPLLSKEIDNALKQFHQIQQHESLRHQYERINNQCLVLLVSYFTLAVESVFKESIVLALQNLSGDMLKSEPIKVTIDDLRKADFDLRTSVGDLIAKEISFQDMQSIARAFQTYYGIKIVQDKNVNNIILGQACRHVIVHSGGIVSQRLQGQIVNAKPRQIKTDLVTGEELGFNREEVRIVGESMMAYLAVVVQQTDEALARTA